MSAFDICIWHLLVNLMFVFTTICSVYPLSSNQFPFANWHRVSTVKPTQLVQVFGTKKFQTLAAFQGNQNVHPSAKIVRTHTNGTGRNNKDCESICVFILEI